MSGPPLVIAESRFDKDAEGWTAAPLSDGDLVYNATAGHPGGCVEMRDHGTGGICYFQAPEKFLGNKRGSFRIDYDVKRGTGPLFVAAEMKLIRGDRELQFSTSPPPSAGVWVTRSVTLAPGDGWIDKTHNKPATARDFEFVLNSLEKMYIRAEFTGSRDITYLDNVVMLFHKEPPVLPPG
ncbi:MAG TPA: laminin B domain-containing protein [Pyrinomonadaceae bacterium]|jgi:hypothetical protein|nr:laminin B domain-containing protein [Pyrinomonadaceae bacterium]